MTSVRTITASNRDDPPALAAGIQDCRSADHFHDRIEGHSKMAGHIVTEALWMVWWLWLQNGLRDGRAKRRNIVAAGSILFSTADYPSVSKK